MTEPAEPPVDSSRDPEGDAELRRLLRGALDAPPDSPPPDLLRGVQQRIRQRSGGRFYADGWSTATDEPIWTYFATAVVMLVVVGLAWAALSSPAGAPVEVDNAPAPIQVIPPQR